MAMLVAGPVSGAMDLTGSAGSQIARFQCPQSRYHWCWGWRQHHSLLCTAGAGTFGRAACVRPSLVTGNSDRQHARLLCHSPIKNVSTVPPCRFERGPVGGRAHSMTYEGQVRQQKHSSGLQMHALGQSEWSAQTLLHKHSCTHTPGQMQQSSKFLPCRCLRLAHPSSLSRICTCGKALPTKLMAPAAEVQNDSAQQPLLALSAQVCKEACHASASHFSFSFSKVRHCWAMNEPSPVPHQCGRRACLSDGHPTGFQHPHAADIHSAPSVHMLTRSYAILRQLC